MGLVINVQTLGNSPGKPVRVVLGWLLSPDLGIPEETGVFAQKVMSARRVLPARKA